MIPEQERQNQQNSESLVLRTSQSNQIGKLQVQWEILSKYKMEKQKNSNNNQKKLESGWEKHLTAADLFTRTFHTHYFIFTIFFFCLNITHLTT